MHYRGEIQPGACLETVSLRDTRFVGEFVARERIGDRELVRNTITGRAFLIAESEIVVNTADPMIPHLSLDGLLDRR